ncbi:PAS domain S-box protein [Oceanispirochaeta crateris]|nr:PAS domain S-box protein [Oceanispirochaeta crateris]
MTFTLLIEVTTNISLLLTLLFIQNLILNKNSKKQRLNNILQGILIGFISIIIMNNSIYAHPEMIFDSRTILLCITGLYLGLIPTSIAAFIAGLYRFALGGSGMYVGIMSIVISAGIGLLVGLATKKKQLEPGWIFNFVFGFAVHAIVLLLFYLFLPKPDNLIISTDLALTYLLILPLATGLIGRMLSFQSEFSKSRQKLQENSNLFHTLFRKNHTIMFLIDPQTEQIKDANESAVEFYGWSYNELLTMTLSQINSASQAEIDTRIRTLQNEDQLVFKTQHNRADGSRREVEVYSNLIQIEGKELLYSLVHDITDRVSTEKKLQKSEYQLSRAELMAQLGHWELDLNAKSFSASLGAHEIYGVPDGDLDMSVIQDIPLKEYRPAMNKALAELISKDAPYDLEFDIIRPSDQKRSTIHSTAQYDKDTNTVFGVIHDITRFKQAEEEIRVERERLRVTLQSIGDGVITTDNNGRIQMMNQVAERLTGWSNSESFMKPLPEVFNIVNEYSRQPCPNPVELVLNTKGIIELANYTMLISKDGRELIIADSGAPIKDNKGEIIGTILVFRDTTEKQRTQDRIIRAEKLESLGVLAGGIAHDFNNLLAGIFGYMELAQLENTNEKVREYLDQSVKVYKRTVDLTKQLLTFSKGNILNRKIGNLSTVIQDAANFALSGSIVTCDIRIEDNLYLCSYDENQIGQVLDNLLINAKQAMPDGGTIKIKAKNLTLDLPKNLNLPKGHYVGISISDTGPGIPSDLIPRIFDPFFSTKQMGSGLGLATCFSILEKHDGAIDVYSNKNGTTFTFYIPAAQGFLEEDDPSLQNDIVAGGKILIMDDEPSIRVILGEYLKTIGFEVTEASDGQELLDILKTAHMQGIQYKAAILDLTIPGGMGGVAAVKEIRNRGYTFPVFATSGYSEDSVISDPEQYGFTGSLSKPFKMKDLSSLLSRYLK